MKRSTLLKTGIIFLIFISLQSIAGIVSGTSQKTGNNFVLQSVQTGDFIILTDKKGKQIGFLKTVGKDTLWYGMDYKPLGLIMHSGNLAILVDKDGKQQGLIQKIGNSYILEKKQEKYQSKEVVHVNK